MTAITGGRFTIKDTNYFLLPGNSHMLHLATIGYGLREFVVMLSRGTNQVYIEEVVLESKDFSKDVFANFKFIADDSLAEDLAAFAEEQKVIDMKRVANTLGDMRSLQWLAKSKKPASK